MKTKNKSMVIPGENITKDEMNLAEYPLSFLSKRLPEGAKTIEWTGEVTLKDGRKTTGEWVVTGTDKYGLPTPSDRDVFLGLMYYWYKNGLKDRELEIGNMNEFLKFIKWTNDKRAYDRLKESLERLKGVTIFARYSFWDNEIKDYLPLVAFSILDEVIIKKEGRRYILKVVASRTLWKSICDSYIKSLNAEFYFSLDNPTAKALYTFLDKKRYRNKSFQIELRALAAKLGLSLKNPTYKIKQLIRKASDILVEGGFLDHYKFRINKLTHTTIVIFVFRDILDFLDGSEEEKINLILEDIKSYVGELDNESVIKNIIRRVSPEVIYRALSEVKEASLNGEIKTTKVQLFMYLLKKYAREMEGIEF
ncbi:MAG TPA: replication initiator protein A [bacterium]|nr:replication initiator protein A [bacterium]